MNASNAKLTDLVRARNGGAIKDNCRLTAWRY